LLLPSLDAGRPSLKLIIALRTIGIANERRRLEDCSPDDGRDMAFVF